MWILLVYPLIQLCLQIITILSIFLTLLHRLKLSVEHLIEVVIVDIFYSCPQREHFQYLLIKSDSCHWFQQMFIIILGTCLLVLVCWELYYDWMLNLIKCLFSIYLKNRIVFNNVINSLIDFKMLNQLFIYEINFTWSGCITLFI